MKTVRFTEVVVRSGQPEVYLLFTKPDVDAEFQKALKGSRIMTVHVGAGSKTDYGVVGYEGKPHAQILIFPRSLKSFENNHVVGIQYDLLHEELESPKEKRSAAASKNHQAEARKPGKGNTESHPKKIAPAQAEPSLPSKQRVKKGKVLKFPVREEEEPEAREESAIRTKVQRAVKALEDGRQVAAFNILKSILES